jgi:hypothetical protein
MYVPVTALYIDSGQEDHSDYGRFSHNPYYFRSMLRMGQCPLAPFCSRILGSQVLQKGYGYSRVDCTDKRLRLGLSPDLTN